MRRPVFLVGMMGAGKSTVGAALAARTGAAFCDLDERIALLFGRTPAALLGEGEAALRRCERAALRSLLAEPGIAARALVVACGGGTVLDADNRADMRRVGVVVLLALAPAALAARLARDPDALAQRPLLHGDADGGAAARLDALWTAREPLYREADVTVDAGGSVDEVVARVRAAVEAHA
ncbi:MAG: hypothetical protein K1X88_08450 [Nannocystaceae bacterium]|nr:hypothetical protein [Nannocystaceae bacterium]